MWRKDLIRGGDTLKNKRDFALIMIGIIFGVVTIYLFGNFNEEILLIDWLGFFFIMIAEISFFGGVLIINRIAIGSSGCMLRSASYIVLGSYMVTAILISVVFSLFSGSSKLLVSLQIIILATTSVILIIILFFSKSIMERNKTTLYSVSNMQEMLNKVIMLQKEKNNFMYVSQLHKVYEGLRFCDNSSSVALDKILEDQINELVTIFSIKSEDQKSKITTLIDKILLLIEQRTLEVKTIKEGEI